MNRFWIKLLMVGGGGCLLFLACATFDIWPLAWIAFVPALLAIRELPPRRAFLWGWLMGTVANGGGFYWIRTLLERFGHMHWAPAAFLFLLLVAYQGLHFGFFFYLVRRVRPRLPGLPMAVVAAVLMTGLEFVMPFIFPWYLAITQAWVLPVIQVADLAGPLGVTFLLMLVNGALYDLVLARHFTQPAGWRWRPAAAAALVVAAALGYGAVRIHQARTVWAAVPKVKVGLVQANIGIVEKGRPGLAQLHLNIHQSESRKLVSDGAELVVWPESSYPYAFERSMTTDWPPSHPYRVMRELKVPLLFGVITYSRDSKEHPYPFNSALMMEPDGRITGSFDKNYLLMFGEYIPFYEHIPSFKKWFPAASNFARGHTVTTFPFRDWRIGPLICYEDIIPAFTRRLAELRPNLLINITNDAWFGATSEPYEHLALAVYRSVELRRGLIRAVNTGVSAFIDSTGKVYSKTRSFDPVITPGVPPMTLLEPVAMLDSGPTVYAAVGDLFGYLCLGGVLTLIALAWRAARREPRPAPAPAGKPRRKRGKR
jgi:apolipoprotein N-acyltransferase